MPSHPPTHADPENPRIVDSHAAPAAASRGSRLGKRRRRSVPRWLVASLATLLLGITAWLGRAKVLELLAWGWETRQYPVQADAILVLGGGLQYRPFEAARLYHEGFASRILVAQSQRSPTDELGVTIPEPVLVRDVLLAQGVPSTAIEPLGQDVTSSFDEAVALRAWMLRTGATTVIIPTDLFHTRRVRWLYRRLLGENRVQVTEAPTPKRYTIANWWHTEEGLIAFQNEVIKYAYYRWRY